MDQPSRRLWTIMKAAALWRAAGMSWESIGAKLKRSPRTCRGWRERFPQVWHDLFRLAYDRLIADTATEAYFILRRLSAGDDKRLARHVAVYLHQLLEVRMARQFGTSADAKDRYAAFTNRLSEFLRSDPDARACMEQLHASGPGGDGVNGAVPATGASAELAAPAPASAAVAE